MRQRIQCPECDRRIETLACDIQAMAAAATGNDMSLALRALGIALARIAQEHRFCRQTVGQRFVRIGIDLINQHQADVDARRKQTEFQ